MDNFLQQNLKKTTPEQFSVLVKEMQKNPHGAEPIFDYNRNKMERFWSSLTSRLNALGPKQRSSMEWKKVWSELKIRTKKNNSADRETGHDKATKKELSHSPKRLEAATNPSTSAAAATSTCTSHHHYHDNQEKNSKEATTIKTHNITSSSTRSAARAHYSRQHSGLLETESTDLLRRQVECEEKLVAALERSNELQLEQLKLMAEQNKLMATTIDGINKLSSKFMEFLENN